MPAKRHGLRPRRAQGSVLIGTSGWSYQHWTGRFYPEELASSEWLAYYAQRFSTVEVNNTFYQLPKEHTVQLWNEHTPAGFRFAVKGSRFITHVRKLREAEKSTERLITVVEALGEKLAVLLWQLPPTLERDPQLLDEFLGALPRYLRHAVEFRHESWLVDETYEVLRHHGVANVNASSDRMPTDLTVTGDFVYVRFHGLAGYHGAYVGRALDVWVDFLREQSLAGRDAYVYFNNDAEACAPADAERLRGMLEELAD